jgi:serine protease Do
MTPVRARLSATWLACLAILTFVQTGLAQRPAPLLKSDKAVLAAFRSVVAQPAHSTVRVLCDDKDAALGTVVAEDGWIVTKASELKGKIVCKLKNGQAFPARLVGVEDACDLAMLKIDAKGLKPITWTDTRSAVVGNWLASPGLGEDPVAIGVVSVAARIPAPRDMPAPPPPANSGFLGIQLSSRPGLPTIGSVEPRTAASEAGLKVGDVILAVEGVKVADAERLVNRIMSFKVGDVIKLKIKRGDEEKEITAKLGRRPRDRSDIQNNMGSTLSARRGGFPAILQHDTVIKNTDCGGPLVGLDGKAVGINIARAGRTESYAIPGDKVQSLLADLRSGKLAPKGATVLAAIGSLKDSISKLKAELAALEKEQKAVSSDTSREKTLAEQIKALKQRLATAEAALARARK